MRLAEIKNDLVKDNNTDTFSAYENTKKIHLRAR